MAVGKRWPSRQGEIVPDVYVGAYAFNFNLNQARRASLGDERLPTIMKAGLSYRPTTRRNRKAP